MGNIHPQPSEYLKQQWVPDSQAFSCCHCLAQFSVTYRRHHCRCCGEVFCTKCWGKPLTLPPEYNYPAPQPACDVCHSLFVGDLKYMRLPRRVVVFRSPKSTQGGDWKPPLTHPADSLSMFFVRISNWRPFGPRTSIRFYKTVSDLAASFDGPDPMQPSSVDFTPRSNLSASSETPRLTMSRYVQRLSDLRFVSNAGQQQKSSLSLVCDAASAISDHETAANAVASSWALPLSSVISIVLDHDFATNYDFVTIETTGERVGLQVVRPVPQSQTMRSGASLSPFARFTSTDLEDFRADAAATSLLSSELARVLTLAHIRGQGSRSLGGYTSLQ